MAPDSFEPRSYIQVGEHRWWGYSS